MLELGFQIALTAILSLTVSSIDLFRDYGEDTLTKAWGWVFVYLLLNVFASVFVFIVLHNVDILSINKALLPFSEWVKSVFCGMFLLTIMKSRVFMVNVGQKGDVLNPEYRFQQIINVIKIQIAKKGLEDNLKNMQGLLMNLSIEELTNGANLITNIDELWLYSEEKNKSATNKLDEINKLKNDSKKKLALCNFIFRFGGKLDFDGLFSVESLLSHKKWEDLMAFLEHKKDRISDDETSYINKLREDHIKSPELNTDSKNDITELICKYYTHSEIFEVLNK
ncbi:membrane protein [Candidatus Magnetobacterium bavaricum]|uniref:Membrane protein n=1 Tax=Candidatus Magnetobacterium bavaricum TaxID=29290 RepID=A0A0F3GLZ8_9BACT|nr:membrane protein [Candidatus Magnetobacterium bavaricum]